MSEWMDNISRWTGRFLGWLLGVEGVRLEEIDEFTVFWDNPVASLGLFVLAVVGAVALVVVAARREQRHMPLWRRIVLGGLRMLALLLLVLVVFLPFVRFNYVEHGKLPLALVLDDTDSVNIKDVRVSKDDLGVAAHVIVPPELVKQQGPVLSWPAERLERLRRLSRAALLNRLFHSAVGDPFFDVLDAFDVRVFRVGEEVKRIERKQFANDFRKVCRSLTFKAKASPIASAIDQAIRSYYGRKPYALLYVGDGSSNKGISLESAASKAKAAETQLHMVLVGIAKAKDVQIEYLDANDVFFKGDKAEFRVVITQKDCDGETCDLILRLNGKEVRTRSIELHQPSQTIEIDHVPTTVTPKEKMDVWEIELTGISDEVDAANNIKTKRTRTIDGKMRVLYVEDVPRWEWRVMRDMMLRDIRVGKGNYHTLLIQADERAVKNHPYYIREFPSPNELKNYHALIIGDVDAKHFLPKEIKAINEFVGKWGGGLMMIAGDRFNPGSYTGKVNRPIQEMMPVLYPRSRQLTEKDETTQPFREGFNVRLTPWAAAYSFTAFDPNPKRNQKLWREFGPFYWHADVRKLHPMAVPLVVHDTKKDEDGTQSLPLIAVRRYGKGRVVFVGIDETWRFRKEVGSTHHRTFWAQAVQHLGVSLLSGATRRIDLRLSEKRCTVDQKIDIEAVVFDRDYKPLKEDEVEIRYQEAGGETKTLTLPRSAKEGIYRASHRPKEEGDYIFWIEDRFSREGAKVERFLDVRQPNVERDNPTVDIERLRKIAASTGGKVWRLDQLEVMRDELTGHTKKTHKNVQKPLWNTWLIFLALVACLTTEWGLRKKWNLR